jgi:hypothetical protein
MVVQTRFFSRALSISHAKQRPSAAPKRRCAAFEANARRRWHSARYGMRRGCGISG